MKMSTPVRTYALEGHSNYSSRIAAVARRAPLIMTTFIFTMISMRNLVHPVAAAAKAGISFTSPGGITIARVGFGAFPLAFAILALAALLSARRRVAGLYMVLVVAAVVIAVRIFGILADHSAESARLLAPEFVLLTLSIIAIRLESAWLRAQRVDRAV
jgi:hypothetical protein